jgi:hypothetical protein
VERIADVNRSVHDYRWRAPSPWFGMSLGAWLRMLRAHRFRVRPIYWPSITATTCAAAVNSLLAVVQKAKLRVERVGEQQIDPPLFIIGFWRTGTTFLHELACQDPRFAAPSTYDCFAPNHFLLTGGLVERGWLPWLPPHRPIDHVALNWHSPQEDEFALCLLGALSPYWRLAFPNTWASGLNALDIESVSPADLRFWEKTFRWYVQALQYKYGQALVLKSPSHTGRVGYLARMFPNARFLHVVREPYSLFASNLQSWRLLEKHFALQLGSEEVRRDTILRSFETMYKAFDRQSKQLSPRQLCTIRFEALTEDATSTMARAYDQLAIGDFQVAKEAIVRYAECKKYYQRNCYRLSEADRREVRRRWGFYFRNFDYD